MTFDLKAIYDDLYKNCKERDLAGHDPFDGLESKVFRALPLRRSAFLRMAWLQTVKRSPIDLRGVARVPQGTNSKGIALFALAEIARYRAGHDSSKSEIADLISRLDRLAMVQNEGEASATRSFGYNFDWQSRAFFAPKGTPTIVPTAFAAAAYIENYKLFGDEDDLAAIAQICRFIETKLQRPVETDTELCLSYTPNDSSVIYNASLLAAETLARGGELLANDEYLSMSEKAARFVIGRQAADGSWAYGPKLRHKWVDNFHTAFILRSLTNISANVPSIAADCEMAVNTGLNFWIENFFTSAGAPKYFSQRVYPIDIHSAAAAIAVLAQLSARDERALSLADSVAKWTFENLRDDRGFFYYQRRRYLTVKTPFIRWGQAWMAYAIASLIEARNRDS